MVGLVGKRTAGGWVVEESVEMPADRSGGYFSSCFLVTKDGKQAFLKALDIEKFDVNDLLGYLEGFKYESDLALLCRDDKLNRVVQVIETGEIDRPEQPVKVLQKVPYLVFELADGDIRDSIDVSTSVSNQWRFFVLRQTTLALLQLHSRSIAHQDVKPSNVLKFGADRLKLGDLGRASMRGRPAPHDELSRPGALNYAPFEQRYDFQPSDWVERRLTADVFHLGCLAVFNFTNVCFPEFVMQRLAEPYRPENWGAPYLEVMPHIQTAAIEALNELEKDFPEAFRSELTQIVLDLCHPDPALRARTGPKNKTQVGLLWLQRYVSRFDVLEKRAGIRGSTNA